MRGPAGKILHVVGARPNFMKIAPVMAAIERQNGLSAVTGGRQYEQVLVHTGQHYDELLNWVFFDDLDLGRPDHFLGVGSGTHAELTAKVLLAMQEVLRQEQPDLVLVPGDINSTLAAALGAVQLGFPVAHLEAGLRSFDRGMPEEVNRVVVDHIAELLLTSCADANANLLAEGIAAENIHYVGNPMIDTLERMRGAAREQGEPLKARWGLDGKPYVVVTLHRPSNVDDLHQLSKLMLVLETISKKIPVVFPVHRRTQARLMNADLWPDGDAGDMRDQPLKLVEPLGYLDFLALMQDAALVLTDSGGVQEETTILNVPCLTVRKTTERPVTVSEGTNVLVDPTDAAQVLAAAWACLEEGSARLPLRPDLWDGHAGERVAAAVDDWFGKTASTARAASRLDSPDLALPR